ncbi:MAG: hypothetical protein R2932_39060 [Caldilineaceae bacterium]
MKFAFYPMWPRPKFVCEEGHVFSGELFVVLRENAASDQTIAERLAAIAEQASAIDWRLYNLVVMPVTPIHWQLRKNRMEYHLAIIGRNLAHWYCNVGSQENHDDGKTTEDRTQWRCRQTQPSHRL